MKNMLLYLILGAILGFFINIAYTNSMNDKKVLQMLQEKCRVVNFGQLGRIRCNIE